MTQITVEEAAPQLSELVRQAQGGEEVILTHNGGPAVWLVPLPQERPRRQAGSARDVILYIAPDFDDTPEGFEDYM